MRKRTETENQIIQIIGDAVRVRLALLRQSAPERATCINGKQIIIPNDLRSNEDILEDQAYRDLMRNGDDIVHTVYGIWFKVITPFERIILEIKCPNRKRFKIIARELTQKGYTDRDYTTRQLSTLYNSAIDKIKSRFFTGTIR